MVDATGAVARLKTLPATEAPNRKIVERLSTGGVVSLPSLRVRSNVMSQPTAKPRILVVEDEYLVRLTLIEALLDEGFDVLEAETGDAALVLLEGDPAIVLLLTDVQLPGSLDGLGLADLARRARPELPAIFVSGRPDMVVASVTSPRDQFIPKPYVPAEVATAARRLASGQS